MGAVLGIAAWGRTQEKVAGTASNYTAPLQSSVSTSTYQTPNYEYPSQDSFPSFNPSTQQVAAAGPVPGYGVAPTAPGGRRPVTPNFSV
jgi:hypothetical protein